MNTYRDKIREVVDMFSHEICAIRTEEDTFVDVNIEFSNGEEYGFSVEKLKDTKTRRCNHTCCLED